MKLNAPKQVTFLVAALLALIGLIGFFMDGGFLHDYDFWFAFAAFLLLGAGTMVADL